VHLQEVRSLYGIIDPWDDVAAADGMIELGDCDMPRIWPDPFAGVAADY